MADTIIKVEGLSKKYDLLHKKGNQSDSLIAAFGSGIKGLLRSREATDNHEDFWALKDVNFEIQAGDRVGIIGRNGAGKSTLLKILSRIVKPTSGRIEYDGRMASLLEVGTGFHGDLSGRENIYLNGSILGMNKKEIDRKFDEIVAFSEIEQFLDTPVKRYSSGMYVRLAFSVAAHLEPEILIVDEVLAVGDSVFQRKCIDKMSDISKQGRTILFVSHSFATINTLCDRAILLERGKMVVDSTVSDAFSHYTETLRMQQTQMDLTKLERFDHARDIIFRDIRFEEMPLPYGKEIQFTVRLQSIKKGHTFGDLDFGVNFNDKFHNTILHVSNRFINADFSHEDDRSEYVFKIQNDLKPGIYSVVLFLRSADVIQDVLENRISIEVLDGNPYGYNDTSQIQGVVMPQFSIRKNG